MHPRSSSQLGLIVLAAVAGIGSGGKALAQAAGVHEIPQSQFVEHQENLDRLASLSGRPGQVGAIARKAAALFKKHSAREAEYIMPPLTLLPYIVDGKVTPDMQWALAMTDRVRTDRELIFNEHNEMIEVLNELRFAGQQAHDAEAVDFAKGAATDALNDVEILEPTVLLIGDILHAKLGASH
jgi:hypothetical protein